MKEKLLQCLEKEILLKEQQNSPLGEIVTRFAPSPTGSMHIGNFRAALFSYAFAKKYGGKFILRIEDTDRERLVEGAEDEIKDILAIMEMIPDKLEKQSDNLFLYKTFAHYLLLKETAYPCYCEKDSDEVCNCKLNSSNRDKINYCVKLDTSKMPEVIKCYDSLREKEIEVNRNTLYDIVLLKRDGYPTYHLASIIDDIRSGVTDIFRGDEWLGSFAYHVYLYGLFKKEPPRFYHMSLITNSEGKKLSKRDGDFSVKNLLESFFIPSAIINYAALLGWSPKNNNVEKFTIHEFVSMFDPKNLNKSSTKFDEKKLRWLNIQHLKETYGMAEFKEMVDLDEQSCCYSDCFYEIVSTGGDLKGLRESIQNCKENYDFPEYREIIVDYIEKVKHKTLSKYDAMVLFNVLEKKFSVKEIHENLRLMLTGVTKGYPFDILIRVIPVEKLLEKFS